MTDQIQNNKPVILSYQKDIYDRLCAYVRVGLNVPQKSIGALKLRKNFFLLGPTGTGKTFLANAVAADAQVPFLSVSVSGWSILGSSSRGSSYTWNNIVEFLKRSVKHDGAIIFVDELDKCYHDSNWNAFLRAEVFSLCDSTIPLGLDSLDDESEDGDKDDDGDGVDQSEHCREKLEFFLRNHTVIIGGAAFQDIWEKQDSPAMGFRPSPAIHTQPEMHELAQYLPRELTNRFCAELFILPKLGKEDYREMILHMADGISETWKGRFLEIGMANIDLAVKYQKGVRYAEEVLLEAIVKERAKIIDVDVGPQNGFRQGTIAGDSADDLGVS